MKNFIPPEKFPYKSALGWEYDSGNYAAALAKAMDMIGYADAAQGAGREARARRADGHRHLELHRDRRRRARRRTSTSSASRCSTQREIRVHPTGKAIARFGTKSQGQGHETTYAQIVAEELGIPAAHIQVEEGDTDTAPYGLGTYASRSTPTAGAAGAMAARKIRDKAQEDRRPPAGGRARTTWSGSPASSRSRARRRRRRRSRRSPSPPTPTIRRAWRPGSRRSTTTTRRT